MNKLLIVEDDPINRAILAEKVSATYEYLEAENGEEALKIIQKEKSSISLILLDLMMPVMDGYQVLAELQKERILDSIPVMVISSETNPEQIVKALDLGASDFVNRDTDEKIVLKRIQNTLALYAKRRGLTELVRDQVFEKETNNDVMTEIVANVIEFRNKECGDHIRNIKALSTIILDKLRDIAPQYELTSDKITNIVTASAYHDIGKNFIPEEVLNKPGRFTDEEFAIMKTHSAKGAEVISESDVYKTMNPDERPVLLSTAYEVCRWHHERYDGRGYPDGLKGEEIPISAQVVALADVYDALISPRVYKAAYSHEKAVSMILNGECGTFNPILMECLREIQGSLIGGFNQDTINRIREKAISETCQKYLDSI